jgi:hypothetical protein
MDDSQGLRSEAMALLAKWQQSDSDDEGYDGREPADKPSAWSVLRTTGQLPAPSLGRLTQPTVSSRASAVVDRHAPPPQDDALAVALREIEAHEEHPPSTVVWPAASPVAVMEARHAAAREAREARSHRREEGERAMRRQLRAGNLSCLHTTEGARWLRTAEGRAWQVRRNIHCGCPCIQYEDPQGITLVDVNGR